MDLAYYLSSSPRRKLLDHHLAQLEDHFHGIVLDIGGRDRGRWQKPKARAARWIFVDIEEKHQPDTVADVAQLSQKMGENMADVILAAELFEHVRQPDQALRECYKVLKPGGVLIASTPFLYPVHGDPDDYQRWTESRWRVALADSGFKLQQLIVMGRFFTLVNFSYRTLNQSWWRPVRIFGYVLYPFFDVLQLLDDSRWIRTHPKLSQFHGGYLVVAVK